MTNKNNEFFFIIITFFLLYYDDIINQIYYFNGSDNMCGVVGIIRKDKEVSFDVMLGLFAIQNRGQESCGISVSDGYSIKLKKGMGLVKEVLTPDVLLELKGNVGVGHVRYPTRGSDNVSNSQPHVVETLEGRIFALASNGDITNYRTLADKLHKSGVRFRSGNDGELLLRYIAYHNKVKEISIVDSIKKMMSEVKGAFSTVLISKKELWAFRDPYGVRPFSFGTLEDGFAFASESKSLDILRAVNIEEVEPGEIIHVTETGEIERFKTDVVSLRNGRETCAHCVFEPVYFSMPDSDQYNISVYEARKRMGKALAVRDKGLEIDVVIPVPDSSNMQAIGYAQEKNISWELGLIRNHYVGRTFIKPDQAGRDESVKQKFNPVKTAIKGKRVLLIDDSIVRGTTMKKIVGMVKSAGASEIHLRIASPPVKFPCFYGLDTRTKHELIANKMDADELTKYFEVDSLKYIEQDDLSKCVKNDNDSFCFACFDGNYPIELVDVEP